MKKPMCEICGERHYSYEPHDLGHRQRLQLGRVVPAVTGAPEKELQLVTKTPPSVTASATAPHCPTCTCFKKKRTNAERQAAYRARKRG